MDTMILKVNCDDYCSDCGRCHRNRDILWGEIAPPCLTGQSNDEDFEVQCTHYDFD